MVQKLIESQVNLQIIPQTESNTDLLTPGRKILKEFNYWFQYYRNEEIADNEPISEEDKARFIKSAIGQALGAKSLRDYQIEAGDTLDIINELYIGNRIVPLDEWAQNNKKGGIDYFLRNDKNILETLVNTIKKRQILSQIA